MAGAMSAETQQRHPARPGHAPPTPRSPRSRRAWPWAALLAVLAVALMAVAMPLWWLRPFEPQSAAALGRAYAVRRAAPLSTLLALGAGAVLAWRLWPRARWWGRLALAAALLAAAAFAWIARQNPFERLFPPLRHPGYAPAAAAASFVAPDEMVLAIRIGDESVAYPVRQVAYHHVVEDVVGGTPLAVTY
jgi:hypothetical protein